MRALISLLIYSAVKIGYKISVRIHNLLASRQEGFYRLGTCSKAALTQTVQYRVLYIATFGGLRLDN